MTARQASLLRAGLQTRGRYFAGPSWWRGTGTQAWSRLAGTTAEVSFWRAKKLMAATSIAAALLFGTAANTRAAAQVEPDPAGLHRVATLAVPGNPLRVFDASVVDGNIYALADRSNHGVDLFDIQNDRFLGRAEGFTGFATKTGFAAAGPNGMVAVGPTQIWAGDGNSTVKVVDLRSHRVIDTISTGGADRVDEMAYDPQDQLVIAANNKDRPPTGWSNQFGIPLIGSSIWPCRSSTV